ncbi:hypothetical protein ACLOJK_025992 [Asimina triloba]
MKLDVNEKEKVALFAGQKWDLDWMNPSDLSQEALSTRAGQSGGLYNPTNACLSLQRWSAYVVDGKVKVLNVEKAPSEVKVSGGEAILDQI